MRATLGRLTCCLIEFESVDSAPVQPGRSLIARMVIIGTVWDVNTVSNFFDNFLGVLKVNCFLERLFTIKFFLYKGFSNKKKTK